MNAEEIQDNQPSTQPVDNRILKNVIAFVEVRSTNDNRSGAVERELERLGATVEKKFTNDVTHVIFKEGSNRTKIKAQKKGLHLVSVLWVDSCKTNQKHVSERLYPAVLPKQKGKPLFIAKMKKARSMQPRDFEEELANSTERINRKKRKLERILRLHSSETTPYSSPQGVILVQDTQPRSPATGLMITPVRLAIPETPPSMRAKIKQLQQARLASSSPASVKEIEEGEDPLQRRLFKSVLDCDFSSSSQSSVDSSGVFLSENSADMSIEEEHHCTDTSVTEDVLRIAKQINQSLKKDTRKPWLRRSIPANFVIREPELVTCDSSDQKGEHLGVTDSVTEPDESRHKYLSNGDLNVRLSRRQTCGASRKSLCAVSQETKSVAETNDILHEQVKKVRQSQTHSFESEDHLNHLQVPAASCVPVENCKKKYSSVSSTVLDKVENAEESALENGRESQSADNQMHQIKTKKPKRKLLSVADICDPPSVLVEPTKCSQVQRQALVEEKKKQCRKKKTPENISNDSVTNSSECSDGQLKRNKKVSKRKQKVGLARELDTTAKNQRPQEVKDESIPDNTTAPTDQQTTVDQTNLADDTYNDDVILSPHPLNDLKQTHMINSTNGFKQNISLNVTDEVSLSCTGKDNTLGLSMSTAYTDTTLPSFLQPKRRSMDEFSQSHLTNRRKRGDRRKTCMLSTVLEKENAGQTSSQSGPGLSQSTREKSHKNIRPSLVMTSLHSHEQDVVIFIVKKLGGFVLSENVNETTTHVVCGEFRRTLNVLHSLARGLWLLSKEWVLKSLDACTWLPEEPFECHAAFPTCKLAREERQKAMSLYRQTLFQDIGPIYVSGRAVPPRNKLLTLIKLCGGQVTANIKKAQVYLGSDLHPDIRCLKVTWLLDSITDHTVLPYDHYRLDRPKRESSPVY